MRMPPVLYKAFFAKALALIAVAAMLTGAPRPAAAEDWPTRPITMIVAFPPGGSVDFLARSIAHHLTDVFGQPVIVENKSGAGGVIATNYVAKTAPDGYTILMTAIGPAVFRPIIDQSAGYDTDKDFTPIIMAGNSPNVLLASPKLGGNTVKELVAYADKNQHRLSIAHPGPGTMGHLCAVLFAREAHIDGSFIAYRGAPPIVTDLMGGQIDIGFPTFGPGSQSVKILAVTTEERVDFLPDVPTMKESGLQCRLLDLERDIRARQCAARDRQQAQCRDECLSAQAGDPPASSGRPGCQRPGRYTRAAARTRGARPCQVVDNNRRHEFRYRRITRVAVA